MIYVNGEISDLITMYFKPSEEFDQQEFILSLLNAPIMKDGKVIGVVEEIDMENGMWEGVLFEIPILEFAQTGENSFITNLKLINQAEVFFDYEQEEE